MNETTSRKPKTSEKAKPIVVVLTFDPNTNPISAGFRQNWIDGENDDSMINLSCGAGVGTPFMVFSRTDKKTKQTRYAVCDVRPILNMLAAALA